MTPRRRSTWLVVRRSRRAAASALMFAWTALAALPQISGARPREAPVGTQDFDIGARIDVNQISMSVTNTGSIAFDKMFAAPGFEFPRGSGRNAVFAAGPWFGGLVNGQLRVALSEYNDEFGPGPVIGGVPDDPFSPLHRVYKLNRSYPTSAERDAALAAYQAGAEPFGAPDVEVQPDGTLNILGDQMLWAVYNDLDPNNHYAFPGGTLPLGIEVRQTTYAYDRPDAAGRAIFIRYQVANVSLVDIRDLYVAMWSDPDLGGAADDLVGCDSTRGVGYCYNADDDDLVYGTAPPAVGFDWLGARTRSIQRPMTAFTKYINGTDPNSALQSYHYLRGLNADGSPILNPIDGNPTTFVHTGDPVAGTGWLDSSPADRRMMLSSGPFDFPAGDTLEMNVVVFVGPGENRLDSITRLMATDDTLQSIFDGNPPPPPPPPCAVEVDFDFAPNTLNLRSMGRWVSARLEPPAPFTPEDIDVGSIRLAGAIPVDLAGPVTMGDGDGNGVPDLTVKFDRAAVQAALAEGDSVPVPISGEIGDECFVGGDVARLIHAPVTSPAAGAIIHPGLATPIRWETPPGVAPLWVAVLASLDGGENWTLIAQHLPNTGAYSWQPPYAAAPNARVAVVLVEHEGAEGVVEGVLGIGGSFSIGSTTGVGPAGAAFALHRAGPHPARHSLRLRISLPDGAPANLSLHDLAGRKVWSREVGALGAGTHTVVAGEGARLRAGVYLARLRRDGQERTTRAVLVP